MKYILKQYNEAEQMVEYLNSIAQENHTLEGLWATPEGVYAVIVFWDEFMTAKPKNQRG